VKRGKKQKKEGENSQEELCFAFFSEQKLLEGIASSEVEKVTNKIVTCAVDAAVSDLTASTVLVSRKADSDAALEFYALLGFVPKSPGGGGEGTYRRKSCQTKEISSAYQLANIQRFCTC